MTSTRDRRIAKELNDIMADKSASGVTAAPKDGHNMSVLIGTLTGPPDTPYAGGCFQVEIKIPDSYPFKPPVIKFVTKVWHPNVSSQTGAICLDTLGSAWSPVQTIKTALISLRMLLEIPNPKDPQDAEVARMLNETPKQFAEVAHEWAVREAGAPRRVPLNLPQYENAPNSKKAPAAPLEDPRRYHGYHPALVDRFVNMGFDLSLVIEAFQFVGIDTNDGEDYELEEAYMGDITAYLLGEQ